MRDGGIPQDDLAPAVFTLEVAHAMVNGFFVGFPGKTPA
jgi:hypothetical protein